jgi:hypothetical protein
MSKRAVAVGPQPVCRISARIASIAFLITGGGAASAQAQTQAPTTVEQLLSQAWEIAGYTTAGDNRASLILFRHPGVNSLVQCSVHYDPTRKPFTVVNCYELR